MTSSRSSAPWPYWHRIKLPADRRLDRSLAELHRAIASFIEQARERLRLRPELREHPENFLESMHRVFPDRAIVDIPNDDPIFHVVYDLSDRYQVPGARYIQTGVTEKCEGCPPRWRGIYDDRGRVMVAMTFQSDLGDSWEWADDPGYDEKFSALGIRIGINYITYAMTH